jgi:multiple sugar transport system permease protein/cellobiose transport system permease protein
MTHNKKITPGMALIWAVLVAVTVLSVFPFYLMIVMGTRTHQENSTTFNILPGTNLASNAAAILKAGFARFYFNSFYIAAISAFVAVAVCSMAGFALAKYRFAGKSAIFSAILATMMLPFGVSIVGYLIEMRAMRLGTTHMPLIISTVCSAYGVYLTQQFMRDGVPNEVIESARIDGATEPRIYASLALPFTKPACMTLFVLLFMNSWNSFLVPLIFVSKQSMYTVPLGVFSLGNEYTKEYGARMFALALSTLPVLAIYVLNSKNLVKGIMLGAVKG